MIGQLQLLEPCTQIGNRHVYQFRNALATYFYIVGFLLESGSVTVRTDGLSAESAQHHTVLYLVLVLLHHSEEFIDAHTVVRIPVFLCRQTMPEPVFLLLGQLIVWLEDREVEWFCTADKLFEPHAHLLSTPANHAAVVKTERGVGNHEFLIDAYHASESLAGRAGAQWRVEGKHVVCRFFKGDAVCLETGREIVADIARQEDNSAGTVSFIEGCLGRIEETADVVLLITYRRTVDDEINLFPLLFYDFLEVISAGFQQFLVCRFQEVFDAYKLILLHDAGIAFLHVHLQLLAEASAFDDMDRCKDDILGTLRILAGTG